MVERLPHLGAHFPAGVQLATRMPALPAEHSQVLFELRTSDLVTRFKEATAQLLIYLSNGVAGYDLLASLKWLRDSTHCRSPIGSVSKRHWYVRVLGDGRVGQSGRRLQTYDRLPAGVP